MTDIEKIYDLIISKCTPTNGCLVYQGKADRIGWGGTYHNLRKSVWKFHNPDHQFNYHHMRLCKTPKCCEISHIHFSNHDPNSKDGVLERLLYNSDIRGDCIISQVRSVGATGHGRIKVNNISYGIHRVIYWIFGDFVNITDLPGKETGFVVRHKCREVLCLNKNHLEGGTRFDNEADNLRDGTHPQGERSGHAKITLKTAQAIADSWKPTQHPDYLTVQQRSSLFGVTSSCISHIDNRQGWPQIVHPNGRTYRKTKRIKKTLLMDDSDWECLYLRLLSQSQKDTKVNKYCGTPCWRPKNSELKGNLRISYKSKNADAYRWAAQYTSKRIASPNDHALHKCGEGLSRNSCHNPEHLILGTAKENAADRRIHFTSSKKLDINKVNDIRKRLRHGDTLNAIADTYGVSRRAIDSIKRGESWV